MPLYLSSLFKESLTVSSESFLNLLDNAIELLKTEKGKIGNLTIQDRLVKLEPKGEALIIGDLHGSLESLKTILQDSGFVEKMARQDDAYMVFLGDYGDRGAYSAEVYYIILSLKLAYPDQVIRIICLCSFNAASQTIGRPFTTKCLLSLACSTTLSMLMAVT